MLLVSPALRHLTENTQTRHYDPLFDQLYVPTNFRGYLPRTCSEAMAAAWA